MTKEKPKTVRDTDAAPGLYLMCGEPQVRIVKVLMNGQGFSHGEVVYYEIFSCGHWNPWWRKKDDFLVNYGKCKVYRLDGERQEVPLKRKRALNV